VLVLAVGVVALGTGASAGQAAGVCLVGAGVVLVRGLHGGDTAGLAFGLSIATAIAAYTLVDKHGIEYADPITYLELGMIPAAAGYLVLTLRLPSGRERVRSAVRLAPVSAGIITFAAYGLVLAALARAPAAPVAAVRETSVVIVAVLAAPLLGEHVDRMRVAGAGVVVLGVALLALD
jgi:drug/metabolite transporter (DMT)-like permease